MKKIFYNNRIVALAFFTVFSVSTTGRAGSNRLFPAAVKYAGTLHQQPLYKLVVAGNSNLDIFTITIRDKYGFEIYTESIQGENFTKSFVLNTDETGDDIFYFEIINKRTNQSVSCEMSRYAHLETVPA